MPRNPSPLALLNKRIAERLNSPDLNSMGGMTTHWTPAMVQCVIGVAAELILEAVAEGEEVQFGHLGRFAPRVLEQKAVHQNFGDGSRVVVPRRIKVGFETTSSADRRMEDLTKRLRQ